MQIESMPPLVRSTQKTPALELAGVSKSYPGGVKAVDDVSLTVNQGEILALLGPSGCGKSTTLRLLAGIERPDSGVISIDGRPVAGGPGFIEPEHRNVAMVFQDYSLFPHLNLWQNVAFAMGKLPRRERKEKSRGYLAKVGLENAMDRFPHQLSGGQKQRVALARALAQEPELILLDEPFSNLDANLREQTREYVMSILRESGITTILVTHDKEDAFAISDRMAVMFDGSIVQTGDTRDLYANPADPRVARFLGAGSVIEGSVQGESVVTSFGTFPHDAADPGDGAILLHRENIKIDIHDSGSLEIGGMTFLGNRHLIQLLSPDGKKLEISASDASNLYPGRRCELRCMEPVRTFTAEKLNNS